MVHASCGGDLQGEKRSLFWSGLDWGANCDLPDAASRVCELAHMCLCALRLVRSAWESGARCSARVYGEAEAGSTEHLAGCSLFGRVSFRCVHTAARRYDMMRVSSVDCFERANDGIQSKRGAFFLLR